MALKKSDLYSSIWAACDELRGGIPARDLDALGAYWKVLPGVRGVLFDSAGGAGYARLRLPLPEVTAAIHPARRSNSSCSGRTKRPPAQTKTSSISSVERRNLEQTCVA